MVLRKIFRIKIVLPVLITLLTIWFWLILILKIPIFTHLHGWFWGFRDKPAGSPLLLVLLFTISYVIIRIILSIDTRDSIKLFFLIILGFTLQLGFAFTEGRGMDGIKDRLINSGHAEFTIIALKQQNVLNLVSNYEKLSDSGELGKFSPSKPPGQLILYIFTSKLADILNPEDNFDDKLDWFRTFTAYFWTLISCLVLIPLFYFTKLLIDSDRAILACILYLFIPSVNLITMHTDQVFFPCFFMTAAHLALYSCTRRNIYLSFMTGVFVYLMLFCSFGLIFILPFIMVICIFFSNYKTKFDLKSFKMVIPCIFSGMIITGFLFRIIFGYQILIRYQKAIAYHVRWKGWISNFDNITHFAKLNMLEFIVWLGFPIAILTIYCIYRSFRQIFKRNMDACSIISLMLFLILMILDFFGMTMGEVARIWLFLVPVICIVAGSCLETRFRENRELLVPLIIILQAGSVYLIKVFQDFH